MTSNMTPARKKALAEIRRNIEKSGFHIYIVAGQETPRFAYTIGLRETLGAELVVAGCLFYETNDEVVEILHSLRKQLIKRRKDKVGPVWGAEFSVRRLGSFRLRKAHASWSRSLLLGALDYHNTDDIDAYQIVPENKHHTVDIPDMTKPWSASDEPAWQWLHNAWQHPVPQDSEVMTDLAVLRGASVTQACRWEEDYWEMFAGSGDSVPKSEARLVPLGCLLATDPSLTAVVELAVGDCLWRDSEGGTWNRK